MGVIVVRAINFKYLPDVELIVQKIKGEWNVKETFR